MMDAKEKTAVVIGGGVAGLAAARQLMIAGIKVTVLEKNSYAGGRVHTQVIDGFEIETCAEFFTNFYDLTKRLIRELGLQDDIVSIPGSVAISRAGHLYKIWPPSLNLLFTGLVSFRSKLTLIKILGPLLRYWKKLDIHASYKAYQLDTRSIAEYVHNELDDELLEYLFEPGLAGISYWTPEHTSQLPLFLLVKLFPDMKFFTLDHGIGRLPKAMAANLQVQYNAEVTEVIPTEHNSYTVEAYISGQKSQITANSIVCATPATMVPKLFPLLTAKQRAFFEGVSYSATVDIYFGLDHRLSSGLYGIFYSRCEVENLAAVVIQSGRDPNQLPPGRDSIKLFSSGPAARKLLDKDDAFIKDSLLADLHRTGFPYNPEGHILFSRVNRVPLATPEFDVGYYQRLKSFAEGEIEAGRIVFAGDYLSGPFIEGAITSGLKAANKLMQLLRKS
jgi:oxygen-dependent protoporphyrinogen oxidase